MTDRRLAVGTDHTQAEAQQVAGALDNTRVIIRIGPDVHGPAATAAGALVSMLARLHPHIDIDGDANCDTNPWNATTVTDVLGHLDGHRPAASSPPQHDLVLGIGAAPGDLCIGGDDWTARLGTTSQSIEPGVTALGVHAAASLAAAEVLKRALSPLGMITVPVPGDLVWNLVDHQLKPAPTCPPVGCPPAVLFAGAGSVNSSAAAQLMTLGTGATAGVVDPDSFDPTRNPYRYPAAHPAVDGPKAHWVANMLRTGGWTVDAYEGTVADWVDAQEAAGFDGILVSSVDTVDGRADVADVLAKVTLSAGVDGLALHVQREHPFDDFACPNCDFADEAQPITQVQVIADLTGVDLPRAAALAGGAALTAGDLAAAIAAGRIPPGSADELVGRRVRDLIGRVYAEATIPTATGAPLQVSAPFVSWIAGTLLAAEVAKAAAGILMVERRIDIDMAGVPSGAVSRRPRSTTGTCLCASPWRRRAARRLYGP
jgi:hypothetical protein